MANEFLHESRIEVITGCMYSGKTEELVRRMSLLQYGEVLGQTFLPAVDERKERSLLLRFPNTIRFDHSHELLRWAEEHPEIPVMGIDEAQFCDDDLPRVVNQLVMTHRRRAIVAGLNLDYLGRAFGPIPTLLAMATVPNTLLTAVCHRCHSSDAVRSHRLLQHDRTTIKLGGKGEYIALCLNCFREVMATEL